MTGALENLSPTWLARRETITGDEMIKVVGDGAFDRADQHRSRLMTEEPMGALSSDISANPELGD